MCIPVCLFNLRAMSKDLKFTFGESSQYEQQDRVKFKPEPGEPLAKNSTTRVGVREPSERVMRLMAEILEKDERCKTSAVRKQSGADGVAKFVREAVAVKSIQRKVSSWADEGKSHAEADDFFREVRWDSDEELAGANSVSKSDPGSVDIEEMKREIARLKDENEKLVKRHHQALAFEGKLHENMLHVGRGFKGLAKMVEDDKPKDEVQQRIQDLDRGLTLLVGLFGSRTEI